MRKYVKPEVDIIEFGKVDILMESTTAASDDGIDKDEGEEPKNEPTPPNEPQTVDGTTSEPTVSTGADDTGSNEKGGGGVKRVIMKVRTRHQSQRVH
ncbi:hypothetical protein NXH76_13590 [Blautia schinkii]|nr:hypothetical protein [Blautia schinkii]